MGVGPSPLMYFAVFHFDLDGGIQVTGSHNPGSENGFKMMLGKASLYGDDIQTLAGMIQEKDFDLGQASTVENVDLIETYTSYMAENISIARKDIRFVVDAGNGASALYAWRQ